MCYLSAQSHPITPCVSMETINLFFISMLLYFLEGHINGIIHYVNFWYWLFTTKHNTLEIHLHYCGIFKVRIMKVGFKLCLTIKPILNNNTMLLHKTNKNTRLKLNHYLINIIVYIIILIFSSNFLEIVIDIQHCIYIQGVWWHNDLTHTSHEMISQWSHIDI